MTNPINLERRLQAPALPGTPKTGRAVKLTAGRVVLVKRKDSQGAPRGPLKPAHAPTEDMEGGA